MQVMLVRSVHVIYVTMMVLSSSVAKPMTLVDILGY